MQAVVASVERARVILYEGEKRTAAERGFNTLLAACSWDIAWGDGGEKPNLHPMAAKVTKPRGATAMNPVLETTILFNWKCAGHNGIAISRDRN